MGEDSSTNLAGSDTDSSEENKTKRVDLLDVRHISLKDRKQVSLDAPPCKIMLTEVGASLSEDRGRDERWRSSSEDSESKFARSSSLCG